MAEFILIEKERNVYDDSLYSQSKSEYIEIDKKKVVYFTNTHKWGSVVVVPGVVVSKEYKTPFNKTAVDVEPIKDTELKSKLTKILKTEDKNISFW